MPLNIVTGKTKWTGNQQRVRSGHRGPCPGQPGPQWGLPVGQGVGLTSAPPEPPPVVVALLLADTAA